MAAAKPAPGLERFERLAGEMIAAATGGSYPIEFRWLNRREFNAHAAPGNLVLVDRGVVAGARKMFRRALARRDLLIGVGDHERERFDAASPPGPRATPRCEARRAFADALAEAAFCFVALHETAHHTLGHLDAIAETGARFAELASAALAGEELTREEAETRHAMECGADRHALLSLARLLTDGGFVFPAAEGRVSSPDQLARLATLAYMATVLHFDDVPRDVDDYRAASHPHPCVRFLTSSTFLKEFWSSRKGADAPDSATWEEIFAGAIQVVGAFADERRGESLRLLTGGRSAKEFFAEAVAMVGKTDALRKELGYHDPVSGAWKRPGDR